MSFFLVVLVLTWSSLHCHVISASDDVNFQPFDCYRDLCTSRRQFCSDREQRCKYCQPGHCFDLSTAPKQCRPVCPELLKSTTQSTTSTGTVTAAETFLAKIDARPYDELTTRPDAAQQGMLLMGGLLVLLVIVLVLVVINLIYTRRLHGRLPAQAAGKGRGVQMGIVEEGQALLGIWGSNSSTKTEGGISQVTSTTLPSKRERALGASAQASHDNKSVQTDLYPLAHLDPPYTARTSSQQCLSESRAAAIVQPSAAGDGLHHKGYDYRLLPAANALMEGCDDNPRPHPGSLGMVGPDHSGLLQYVHETYPKSL